MNETVSCKSCRHIRFNWGHFPFSLGSPYAWNCDRIQTEEKVVVDPVFGKEKVEKSERTLCVSARGKYGKCGVEGLLWEPKEKKNFFVYLKRI